MEKYLTVRFFKRLITFTVLAIILALTVTTIILSVRVSKLEKIEEAYLLPAGVSGAEPLAYQSIYPEMYIEGKIAQKEIVNKSVYLTFDDGPSVNNTPKILDTLKKHNAKATFFIVGNIDEETRPIIQRIIDEGHTIGIHTYSHDYENIYKSVNAYLADFERLWSQLKEEFGYEAQIFRFPGGSVNSYNFTVCQQIIAEMYRRGFVYFDWNVSAEDASGKNRSADSMERFIVEQIERNKRSIVLMHDSRYMETTADSVEGILDRLQDKGYTFERLSRNIKPVSFSYLH